MAYHSKYTGAEVDALLDKVESGEVGGKVTVDSALSTESENPVMNKVITVELNNKADKGEVTAALNTKADKNETDTKLAKLSEEISGVSTTLFSIGDIYPSLEVGKKHTFTLENKGDAFTKYIGFALKNDVGTTLVSFGYDDGLLQEEKKVHTLVVPDGYSYIKVFSDGGTPTWNVDLHISFPSSIVGQLDDIRGSIVENAAAIEDIDKVINSDYADVYSELITTNAQKVYAPLNADKETMVEFRNESNAAITFGISFKTEGGTSTIKTQNVSLAQGEIQSIKIAPMAEYSYFLVYSFPTDGKVEFAILEDTLKRKTEKNSEAIAELVSDNPKVFSDNITTNGQKVYAPLKKTGNTKIELVNEGADIAEFGLSFRNDQQTLQIFNIPALKSGESYTLEIPYIPDYAYIKVYSFTSGNVRIYVYGDSLSQRLDKIESQLKEDTNGTNVNSILMENGILLIGASFADANENNWFEIASERFSDKSFFNKAVGSTNVMYDAWRMKNGTLYSAEEWEQFDVLMIDHVHDKDVFELKDIAVNDKTFTGSQLAAMSAADYESNGIIDYFATKVYDANVSMERELYYGYREPQYYAAAYDYLFKKYRALCYAAKDDNSSQWYNSPFGKPCQVVLLTHWNDGRPTINKSLAKLGAKWNSLVVNLSLALGFAPSRLLLDSTRQSYNESTYYARDNEYVDNQYYGKHLQFTTSAPYPYIQRKIASIVAKIVE